MPMSMHVCVNKKNETMPCNECGKDVRIILYIKNILLCEDCITEAAYMLATHNDEEEE